jgi:two-component system sensor histidine kinase CreC
MFGKFYSLARQHSRKKSTGLGLSFVKEIAALHRGRVELHNRSDMAGADHASTGAVASLWLPCAPRVR